MIGTAYIVACLLSLTTASPFKRASSPYAPVPATCPAQPLVRQANGISAAETSYVQQRYQKASQALQSWLKSIDSGFQCGNGGWGWSSWNDWHGNPGQHQHQSPAPVIALTSSGGGYRAMLSGAGVIKGFDGREAETTAVSGLYQALTYEAGLSGGSWLLSSIAGNNYPTISQIQTTLWEPYLQNSLLVPPILLSPEAAPIYNAVEADIQAKRAAGFPVSIIDPWGRILSQGLLYGSDGGVADTISGIQAYSNFSSHKAPYPIITALGSDLTIDGVCIPQANATQYEAHPYEFGSWDAGVDAFVVSEYLGTNFSAGKPTGQCYTNFDQLGFILGTSSNVFASACSAIPAAQTTNLTTLSLPENFAYLVAPGAPGVPEIDDFALYPNPFQNFPSSPLVASQSTLTLVDGGVGTLFQGNPIWPFLHRTAVDVVIVNDNSADTADNYPDGTEIYNTYLEATAQGLTTMPDIPSPAVFASAGLNGKPTFFGCNDPSKLTIIFIPNHNYIYDSGTPTIKIQYYVNETDGMIANGVQIANYGGKADWPLCLACGIMKKSGETLPDGCAACFAEYCYN